MALSRSQEVESFHRGRRRRENRTVHRVGDKHADANFDEAESIWERRSGVSEKAVGGALED